MLARGGGIGRRTTRIAAAAVLVVGGGVWGVATVGQSLAATTAAAGSWHAHPNAFPVRYSWRTGPKALVADTTGCFLGFGADTSGYGLIPGYWQARGDCTDVTSLTPKPAGSGDGPPSYDDVTLLDAVAAPGGGYLAIQRHVFHNDASGYDSLVLRGDPAGGWHTVADFTSTAYGRDGHVGPAAVAVAGDRFVAVGQRDGVPLAWTSTDGTTWQEALLPIGGDTSAVATGVAAGPDGQVVAIGTAGGRPVVWTSADSGGTWREASLPQLGDTGPAVLNKVVRAGSTWLAVGGSGNGATAVVLTSTDGVIWTADDGAALAGARALRSAVSLPDGTVLASAGTGVAASSADHECAQLWRGTGGTWTAEDLGCDGVPSTFAVLTDGRVAAAQGTTLFLSDGQT